MANISNAFGTMKLTGNWTAELIKTLNTLARDIWGSWHYDIQMEAFDVDTINSYEQSTAFLGNGRWAFNSNLECLGKWMEEEIKENPAFRGMYYSLLSGMHTNQLQIEVSYTDEEGGCQVLYNETGVLSSDGKTLVYQVIEVDNYDYTWENYIETTGDEDELKYLISNLCEHLGIEKDEAGLVEQWVLARTYPHTSEFRWLSEELQTEFVQALSSITNKEDMRLYLEFVDAAGRIKLRQ